MPVVTSLHSDAHSRDVADSPLVPWQRLRMAAVTGLGFSLAARSAAAVAGRLPPLSGPPAAATAASAAASRLLPPVM